MKILFSLLMLTILNSSAFAQTLVFSTIEKSVNSDISEEVMREAYKRLGYDIEVRRMPGSRALDMANSGKTDGELYRVSGVNEKYNNLIITPTAINKLEAVAFATDKSIKVNGIDSLKSFNIGIRRGIKFSEKLTKGIKTRSVNSNQQLFSMLEKNRLDIVILARTNGTQALKNSKQSGIMILEPSIATYPLHHYLHKKHQGLVPKLDAVLKNMKEEGFIQSVRDRVVSEL